MNKLEYGPWIIGAYQVTRKVHEYNKNGELERTYTDRLPLEVAEARLNADITDPSVMVDLVSFLKLIQPWLADPANGAISRVFGDGATELRSRVEGKIK